MKTLHIAPGDSAGGSLARAISDAGQADEVLSFLDDLSCGPIASNEPSARATWWSRFHERPEVDAAIAEFWQRVSATDDRLVVWFGRHSASELAFFLAWTDRLGRRPYQIIDVTGQRLRYKARNGSPVLSRPVQAVSIMPPNALCLLLGTEQPITAVERNESAQRWRQLQNENAPFRVVTAAGLASAPADHFDPLLLGQATPEWQAEVRLISDTIGYNAEPYMQTGDAVLLARVVALVEAGKLLADGDPWDMRSCRIRLPT